MMKLALTLLVLFGSILVQFVPLAADEPATSFPEIYNSEQQAGEPPSPQAALESLRLPSEFTATLFAAEPDVQNPIAATVDARGRIWVAENYTYAERTQRFDLSLRDRVVVLEDTDADGVSDRRTVFTDTVQMLTGIVVGQGGVWLMCPPQLLFIPDANDDLIPDAPPEVKLDGFHVARENYHNFANGLSWGPDSWLYGRCGASCPGELGLPGSIDEARVPIRGGIWRFHPQRQVVEALTQGTTNPWGHDWNELGDLLFINTVNGHLWHAIPGAHFVRPHTIDANPHTYELIDMHADHWHFDTGKSWTESRAGAANDYGGGHAHVGMLIYQENSWPKQYHGKLFTVNMHGRRVNTERLEPQGSGYVARHEPDLLLSDDEWFRGMELLPLADGNVLLLDWCDTGECHEATGVHRTSGRIFKISAIGKSSRRSELENPEVFRDPRGLASLQAMGSEWEARRARELLRSMTVMSDTSITANQLDEASQILEKLLNSGERPQVRLRGLFALWAMERIDANRLLALLDDQDAAVRGWAIRLLSDSWGMDNTLGYRPRSAGGQPPDSSLVARLVTLAEQESAPAVRLTLASTLQRLPLVERPPLARGLMSHMEDANDHNLPLMVWYGIMPLGELRDGQVNAKQLSSLLALACTSHWSRTRRLIIRRLTEQMEQAPQFVEQLLEVAIERRAAGLAVDAVHGMALALAGRRQLSQPDGWYHLQQRLIGRDDVDLQRALNDLNVLFGDGVAIDELKRLASDGSAPIDQRCAALQSLVDARAPGLRELCLRLLKQRFVNVIAAQGLAAEEGMDVGRELLKDYRSFAPLDRPRIISILSARKDWAELLLKAVAAGQVDRQEISPFHARQMASFNDDRLNTLLADNWGQVRETNAQREQQMHELKQVLTQEAPASAQPVRGRALFTKHCGVCHILYGQGGTLGPDLTGAQRGNIDYLLENIVDPSAVVTKEFRATVVQLADGRVLTGLRTSQSDTVLTLATQEQTYRIAIDDIEEVKQSSASTMPDGILTQLSMEQLRDLFAYLQSTRQVVEE